MTKLACPNCGTPMDESKESDITQDVCPKCGGVFLDKGELNVLATEMTGDIEYCSIDEEFHRDSFPERCCPKCPGTQMKKINLLRLSDLIFDYCPQCGGFFLDKSEVQRMNAELRSLTPNKKAEEYRAKHGKHLVRVDRTTEVFEPTYLGVSLFLRGSTLRISVFFDSELPGGLRVFQEGFLLELAKRLGLSWGQDIKTGDSEFDAVFRVQGRDESLVAAHLDATARQALLAFVKEKPSVYGRHGSLDITSAGIVYVEGPYTPNTFDNLVEAVKPVIQELVRIADKIQTIP